MGCLFCNGQERGYKPSSGVDFICCQCVQLLLGADQDGLKRAYAKAIEKGYRNKAKAIESFLVDGGNDDDRETKKSKSYLERARPLRKVRPSRNKIRA